MLDWLFNIVLASFCYADCVANLTYWQYALISPVFIFDEEGRNEED